MEDAARSILGPPDLAAGAVGHTGYPDGPWIARASSPTVASTAGGIANERDLPAVRRPGRQAVAIRRRVEIYETLGSEIIYHHKAVIDAFAHECEFGTIGGPLEFCGRDAGPRVDEHRGFLGTRKRNGPNLARA